nr:hypothetical protein CFP56_60496 [Quercus suber]
MLFNYEEITPFRDVHIAEIKADFPFHVTDDVIQKQHMEKFCSWFRNYVMSMDASEKKKLFDKVIWLARYPDNEAKQYKCYVINDVKFRTKDSEATRKTQNSEVYVVTEELSDDVYESSDDVYESSDDVYESSNDESNDNESSDDES